MMSGTGSYVPAKNTDTREELEWKAWYEKKERTMGWFLRFIRWVDLALAPKPGEVLRLKPGSWDPENSEDRTSITLHEHRPNWKRLDPRYKAWKKTDLPTHWVVVEKVWDLAAERVFVRIVSMGIQEPVQPGTYLRETMSGWCQWFHWNFDTVDMDEEKKKKKKA